MQKVRYFLIALLLISCASVQAQTLKWYTNYDEAQKVAQSENKPLFLLFTGSDWCGFCKKLDREVFSKPEFARLSGDKYIFVELDFPQNKPQSAAIKAQNAQLQQKYNIQGYPTVIIVSPQGKKLAQTGYMAGGPKKYAEHLNGLLGKETGLRDAVLDFQKNVADASVDVETAIQPLVSYLEEHSAYDENRWKVEMTLAQYLHSEGCDEEALAFASAGLADAPADHQPVIERFLTYLNA
jgi:thioredoxin-related protein